MTDITTRPTCTRCTRPQSHCLCAQIPCLPNQSQVLVLQHPDESKHPLNTARLAVLGLQQAQLWIGERFEALPVLLERMEQVCVLFPAKAHHVCQPLCAWDTSVPSLLIVPDGTWRQVRKIIHANPILERLPHLSLPLAEPSAYRVRRAREAAAVSTIEAITRALQILEPEQNFSPLLKPFQTMVEQQIQAMGAEVYARNYQKNH